jgi:alkaline phosphatase D
MPLDSHRLALAAGAILAVSWSASATEDLFRVAFGSCLRQHEPVPIWGAIQSVRPDVFLMIGDNVYADTRDPEEMRSAYELLGAQTGFQDLRRLCPVHATWDDHDYGENDAGAEYPMREVSEAIFLDFFQIPADAPQRSRPGVYAAHEYGPPERRVQIILLDTRFFRGPRKRGPSTPECPRTRYLPNDDPEVSMLGEAQWRWLEAQLRRPARLRILASSTQVIPTEHCYEKWANLPKERERLLRMLSATAVEGVVLISGDRHHAEISRLDGAIGYPLYELTSSSLNAAGGIEGEPNRFRLTPDNFREDNFGVVEVDWSLPQPTVSLQIRDAHGRLAMEHRIGLMELEHPSAP